MKTAKGHLKSASFVLGMVLGTLVTSGVLAQSDRVERQQWQERRWEVQQNRELDRQARRQERQQAYEQQRRDEMDSRRPPPGYDPRPRDPGPYDDGGRGRRMTPEERQQLRDQVYEAGRNYRRERR